MDTSFSTLRILGTIVVAVFLVACGKPKLRNAQNEGEGKAPDAKEQKESTGPYDAIRKGVIGQTFQSLTLGTRVFKMAEVIDITDKDIVVRHSGGLDHVPWSAVPDQVREQWGYDPAAGAAAYLPPKPAAPKPPTDLAKRSLPAEPPPKPSVSPEPEIDLKQRAAQMASLRTRMDAQLAGIRSLESDLAQHSRVLYGLQAQLQSVRARQTNKGGIRVERIGGESTLVDRRAEARELEQKIKVQEPLVVQLTQALNEARQSYQQMQREMAGLLK